MTDDAALARPIGWWLKETDTRLDAAFDRALEGTGADRREWQVLSSLARRPVSPAELAGSLASFDEPAAVQKVVRDLAGQGRILEEAGLLRLTPDGEARQAALAPLVEGVRRTVAAALPGDDYATLVRLLARLAQAL